MYKLIAKTEDLKALIAFTSTDNTREVLQALHVTPEYIESTDGRALLRIGRTAMNTDAPQGLYKVSAIAKFGAGLSQVILDAYDGEYPNTDRVIPAASAHAADAVDITLAATKKQDPLQLTITRAVIELYKHTGNAYGMEILKRLSGIDGTWRASKAAAGAPIRMDLISGTVKYIAVILPFKLEA